MGTQTSMRNVSSCAISIFLYALIAGCGSANENPPSSTDGSGANGGAGGAGGAGGGGGASSVWGTFEKPFAADSLWNSHPKNPVLGDYQIPPTNNPSYYPMVGGGPYSTAAFRASESDPPMQVYGNNGANPNCPDEGGSCEVIIPHWPASVDGASGSDGHADIIDENAGIIHSFWQLKKNAAGAWTATMYSWSPLAGSGWADPAHFSQGARASGVCSIAGIIRVSEADDGEEMFHHALALSLDGTAMKQGFVFPATLEDNDSASAYKGQIPMGSLLMLPPDFDTSKVQSPGLLKVIKTLQVYGARVIDRNTDTPFVIYVENGSKFTVSTKPPGEWDSVVANQLSDIAHALRMVTSSDAYIDGDGKEFVPNTNLNRMSMRGPWNGSGGAFDSWQQALVFSSTDQAITLEHTNATWDYRVSWAPWTAGASYRLTVVATGGAKLNMQFKDSMFKTILETGSLGDGESKSFVMPADNGYPILIARSGVGQASSVRGILVAE